MVYRKIIPGEKVKASDMQLAIDQGVLQFSSQSERTTTALSTFTGMLSRVSRASEPRANLWAFERPSATGGPGYAGWVPLGLVPLGNVQSQENFSVPNDAATPLALAEDKSWDPGPGMDPLSIFTKAGDIKLPWKGTYLVGCQLRWTANTAGIRMLYVDQASGSNVARYGLIEATSPASAGETFMSIFGVLVNQNAAQGTVHITVKQTSGAALTIGSGTIGLYLLSTEYG
jgi:hypothetical protein